LSQKNRGDLERPLARLEAALDLELLLVELECLGVG
jgi:hypothetical protein